MNWAWFLIWSVAGAGLAFLILLTQIWTVKQIQPNQPKRSKRLVIGGAIFRWALFSLFIFLSLQQALGSMFGFFICFMTTRILLLKTISQFSLSWPEINLTH